MLEEKLTIDRQEAGQELENKANPRRIIWPPQIYHRCFLCGKKTKNRKDNRLLKVFGCEFCGFYQLC